MGEKRYFLSPEASLKRLESTSVYNIVTDELYEMDDRAFEFLGECVGDKGCVTDEEEFLRFCVGEGLLRWISSPTR